MDFGLLYENNEGEYVVSNDVRMADISLASLVYLPCLREHILRAYCTFASKQAVCITLFGPRPNNKGIDYGSLLMTSTECFSDFFYRKENKLFAQTL